MHKATGRVALMVFVCCVVGGAAMAQDGALMVRTWDAGGDGTDWFNPANWDPDGTPMGSDALTIGASASTGQTVSVYGGGSVAASGASTELAFGTLFVGGDGSATGSSGALSVSGGATVTLTDARLAVYDTGSLLVDGGTLALAGEGGTAWFQNQGITVANGGRIDLGGNRMMIGYAEGASPADQIAAWIADGTIYTSNPNVFKILFYMDDRVNNCIRVASTWKCDPDCDFRVDLDDLTRLGTYYGKPKDAKWYEGDYNGDGRVDLDDLTLLGMYYGYVTPQVGLLSPPWQASGTGVEVAADGSPTPAPEPGTLALLAMGGVLVLRKRR